MIFGEDEHRINTGIMLPKRRLWKHAVKHTCSVSLDVLNGHAIGQRDGRRVENTRLHRDEGSLVRCANPESSTLYPLWPHWPGAAIRVVTAPQVVYLSATDGQVGFYSAG